ncbi:hypothetical protein Q3G72_010252 [Acer saccharum]|nr:hypothetical protein Q3G72_010252 [Acer saccharum]
MQSHDRQKEEKNQNGQPRESRGNNRTSRFQGRYSHYTPLTGAVQKRCTYSAHLRPERSVMWRCSGAVQKRSTNSAYEEMFFISRVGAVQVALRTATRTVPKAK